MRKVLGVFMFLVLGYSFLAAQDFEYEPSEFGQGKSVGISLFGDGIVGMTFKFAEEGKNQWEINPAYTSRIEIFDTGNNEIEFGDYYHGIAVTGGYNILMGSHFKERKNKVIKNYIGLKGGLAYRGDPELILGLVWHREAFRAKENKYSRGLDLGLKYTRILGDGYPDPNRQLVNEFINVYFKVDWNWFR